MNWKYSQIRQREAKPNIPQTMGNFFYIYIFISNQNLQIYELICWRKSCDAL
jgi:hypothetical protein